MKIQTLILSSIILFRTLLGLDLVVYYRGTAGGTTFVNNMIAAVAPTATLTWINTYSTEGSLVSAVNGAAFNADILLAFNNNGAKVWSAATETIIGSALTVGKISKLIVWDRSTGPIVNVPDLNNIFMYAVEATICPTPTYAGQPPSTGVAPEVGCWTGNWGTHGSVGCANMAALTAAHPEAVAYYEGQNSNQATHVHYCYNGADIMYSATPMDWYFSGFNQKAVDYFKNTMNLLVGGDFCNTNLCGADSCIFGDANDPDQDNDGIPDICDKCPGGDDNDDSDNDGIPDACDICPFGDNYIDNDNDGVPDCIDNCVGVFNPNQLNSDNDSFGDACDNCVYNTNEDQADADNDNIGDVCDYCCANDCTNLPNGKYQSCDTCNGFIKCSNGYLYNYACSGNTVYDDNAKQCLWSSNTCPIQNIPNCV